MTDDSRTLWEAHYPFGGFCFGPDKPQVHIIQEGGKQVPKFSGSALNGEIRQCLYPGFSVADWTNFVYDTMGLTWLNRLGIDDPVPKTRQYSIDAMLALVPRNAPGEVKFAEAFSAKISGAQLGYGKNDVWMAPEWIPMIVPQVWVQWHSETVADLREWGSPYSSQPQRIDFALFWDNRRIAVLIDGIHHYARKSNGKWLADEAEYSKRLAEDRFFRANEWDVFRVANWELRESNRLERIMLEFETYVGFEFFPEWHEYRQH